MFNRLYHDEKHLDLSSVLWESFLVSRNKEDVGCSSLVGFFLRLLLIFKAEQVLDPRAQASFLAGASQIFFVGEWLLWVEKTNKLFYCKFLN